MKWSLKTEERLETEMSVPEEFGGDNELHPRIPIIQTCMIGTFKTIAERKNLDYDVIEAEASIDLDRGDDSRPVMKNGETNVEIKGIKDREKAKKVIDAAEKSCFIHNSVKTDVKTNFELTG